MQVDEAILTRRSIRKFLDKNVEDDKVDKILEAGRWSPSGRNNQPWRFKVLKGEQKNEVSKCTKYSHIIEGSDLSIAIFLNDDEAYDQKKDAMSVGACIQNMLIQATSLGLGTCWLGEILRRNEEVNKVLKLENNLELMAVIAIGYPDEKGDSKRKEMSSIVI